MLEFTHSVGFQVFLGTIPIASFFYLINQQLGKRIDQGNASLNKRMDDLMAYMNQSFTSINDRLRRIEDKVFK